MNEISLSTFDEQSAAIDDPIEGFYGSQAQIKRRIKEVRRSLKSAEAKVERCKQMLENLLKVKKASEPRHWAEFRIRLRIGKMWLRDLEKSEKLAIEARDVLSGFCSAHELSLLFAQASRDDKHFLQRALMCGSLLCSRAHADSVSETLLISYMNNIPQLLKAGA